MSSLVPAAAAVEIPGSSALWIGAVVGVVVLVVAVASLLILRRGAAPQRDFDGLPPWKPSSTTAPLAFPRSDPSLSWPRPFEAEPPAVLEPQSDWSVPAPSAQDPPVPVVLHVSSLPPSVAPRFPGGWVMLRAVEVHGTWPAGGEPVASGHGVGANLPPPLGGRSGPRSPAFDAAPHGAAPGADDRQPGRVPLPDSLIEELLRGR
jgi:hypothetical protein